MQSHARLNTDKALRYMVQLVEHLNPKAEAALDAASVRIPLSAGTCILLAESDGLNITVEAPEMNSLIRLEDMVALQLLRLAVGERAGRLAWTRAWEAGRIDPPTVWVNRLGA